MPIPAIPAHGASWDSWAAGIDTAARSAVPQWQPSTAYTAGALVLNPSGQIVAANATFTSGASYVAGNWTVIAGGGTVTGLIANDATTTTAQANSATLAAYIATNPTIVRFPPAAGLISFYGTPDCTSPTMSVREIVVPTGTAVQQTQVSNSSSQLVRGISVHGSMVTGSSFRLVSNAPKGATTLTVDTVTGLNAGDVLYVWSTLVDCPFQGARASDYFPGALVEVRSIDATNKIIQIDTPLYRSLTAYTAGSPGTGATATKVLMHPSVWLHGGGEICHSNPTAFTTPFYCALAHFEFVRDPFVSEISLHDGAGSGVVFASVWGGGTAPSVEVYNLLDDSATAKWLGYAFEMQGGTRNAYIAGVAHHVRHGITTNAHTNPTVNGPADTALTSKTGDPHDIEFHVRTYCTSSQGVDTHEIGHNLVVWAASSGDNEHGLSGSAAMINIRSADTTVYGTAGGNSSDLAARIGCEVLLDAHIDPDVFVDLVDLKLWCAPNVASPDATRVLDLHPGPGTITVRNVKGKGGAQFGIYAQGTNATGIIRGRDIVFDATGAVAGTTTGVFALSTFAGVFDLREVGFRGTYTTKVNLNGITQAAACRVLERGPVDGSLVLYTGSAWPARPIAPAGEVTYRGPSTAADPTDMLTGDVIEQY